MTVKNYVVSTRSVSTSHPRNDTNVLLHPKNALQRISVLCWWGVEADVPKPSSGKQRGNLFPRIQRHNTRVWLLFPSRFGLNGDCQQAAGFQDSFDLLETCPRMAPEVDRV